MSAGIATVVPTHNPGRYLAETLASLERQTLAPVEVVVVDDGSDPAVALPVTPSLPVRLLRVPRSGISGARNAGVRATAARLVHVLDHDDLLEPLFYERMIESFRADGEASIVYANCGFIDADGRDLTWRLPGTAPESLSGSEALGRLLRWNSLASVATVFRRDLFDRLGGFRDLRFVQDWDFCVRAALAGASFRFVPELLAWHRMHPAQQSSEERRREILAESIEMLAAKDVPLRARRSRSSGIAELRRQLATVRPSHNGRDRLRCLLVSPVAPPDPENGDAQFTRDLVENPPPGVEFVRYTDALAAGELEWGPSLKDVGAWRNPLGDLPPAACRAALHVLRARGALLPDPVRWLRVTGSFDLVHVHCMPVRFLGATPPVVASDSAGTWWYWTAARGVAGERVDRLLRRERRLARALGYLHPSVGAEAAAHVLLFVDAGRALLERSGASAASALRCPPGIPSPERPAAGDGRTLLFVARDFETKGGNLALAVLSRVRRRLPEARLLVAGSPGPDPGVEGVSWLGPKSREELYRHVYPRADLFLYPTRFDCAPFVVMEALAHGLPVVAPRAFALPELVRDGETGRLFPPGDVAAAAAAVEELLGDDSRRGAMSAASRRDFEERFSVARRNEILASVYMEAAR